MQHIAHLQELNDKQRMIFQEEYESERKDGTVGVLLALFLGGLGAHRFYMGDVGLGILYVIFVWTFIPALIAFVEAFLMPKRVRAYNKKKARQIAEQVKTL